MKEQKLIKELNDCFNDWHGDFDIDVEQEDHYKGWAYFSVIIAHRMLGGDYEFRARVNDDGDCEMDYNEDCWQDINKANVFAWMWFDTAQHKAA